MVGRRSKRWSRRALLAAGSLPLVSACAHSSSPIKILDPLAALTEAQRGHSLGQQRATMVEKIRGDVRAAAPSADTPALEKALSIVAMLPREEFVQSKGRNAAYIDVPQQIGYGQTISDPYVVSVMTAALDLGTDATVLDVGTGSGYQAAVLARIAKRVFSIEIVDPLAKSAADRLRRLGFSNVQVRAGDGFLGWPENAPFDGIIVAASAPTVPAPLIAQLKIGGRIIMPIGATDTSTQLLRMTKKADGTLDRCSLGGAFFVPLTGAHTPPFSRYGLFDRSIPLCFGTPIVWVF